MNLHWMANTFWILTLCLFGCGNQDPGTWRTNAERTTGKLPNTVTQDAPDSRPGLVDLSKDADELKKAFNAAMGKVRIILLLSPG